MSTVASALIYSSLISTATAAGQWWASHEAQEKANWEQKQAQGRAEEKQKAADEKAETQRLEALKTNQTATDYGNVWGTKANNYADAAQKLSAGTGSFNTDDEETNPFYAKGLL